jgi:hypothetical protein
MATGRWRVVAVCAAAALSLGGCGAASGPGEPSPSAPPPTSASAEPTPSLTPSSAPSSATPSADTPSPSATPTGVTLRQLGFDNGPLDEFSLPSDLVVSTAVDQPNVVTIVLARPSPQTVEDYLRDTLPSEGFTIDARADAGQAMTFDGNGWSGVFTGTAATSAIVLRPA